MTILARITGKTNRIEIISQPFEVRVVGITISTGREFTNYKLDTPEDVEKFIKHFERLPDFKTERFKQ